MRALRGIISRSAEARLAGALLLVAALAAPALSFFGHDDGTIERYLIHLHLGESLKSVQSLYPPSQDWPAYIEPRGHVKRYRVERDYLKSPIRDVDTMWLGFKGRHLAEVQLIYAVDYSRQKTAEKMAGDWALIYGEPHRTEDGRYYWADGSTVLTVFNAEVPVLTGKTQAVELRTSVRLVDRGLWERTD